MFNARLHVLLSAGIVSVAMARLLPLGGQPAERLEMVVSKNVMVTMRDSVRLATDVYRPTNATGPVPIVDRQIQVRVRGVADR